MNQLLLERSTGAVSAHGFARVQASQLLHVTQLSSGLRFDGGEKQVVSDSDDEVSSAASGGRVARDPRIWAHQAGANALAIDIENKLLLSGGVDSSIKLWDLTKLPTIPQYTLKPSAVLSRATSAHSHGITHLSFYPFDSEAFLSSSYDHHLKLFATESQAVSADFDLNSIIYTHALSSIASHLLVACATQHPTVRLVDLRSGNNTHSLAGHHGALLAVSWSPRVEHILASGGIDGTVRLWDIRKSSPALGILDKEDSIGITERDGISRSAVSQNACKSHGAAVNGITWTHDGRYVISAGHDDRIRVWDAATGANTLASFGPTLKNGHLSNLPLVVSPTSQVETCKELLFFPNEKELLMFDLHQGRLVKRLKVPGPSMAAVRSRTGERNVKSRITGLVWRGQADGVYSTHTDGQIRAWLPKTPTEVDLDIEEEENKKRPADVNTEAGQRKRQVLDDIFRDLTRQKISFG
ncbi:WD40-repeat-containing domain protein [Tricladium varicosporioides]|nr:WD40-repeat-containing domain protein [Hymenoscyphus varicosporioides]